MADTTNTQEENTGSIEDIAKSLLVPEETATQEEVKEEASEEPVEASDEQEEAVEEVTAESDEEQEEQEVQEQPEEELYTVKTDGKEIQVPLSDLLRSYSGNSHIQNKMREQAEISKKMEAEAHNLSEQRKALQTRLDSVEKDFKSQQIKRPPSELLQTDPIKYMEELEHYNIQKEKIEEVQAERQRLSLIENDKADKERQAYLIEQGKALVEHIPDLQDAEKAEPLKKAMIQTAVQYGFTESDVSQIQDARALKLLHDVMLFQKSVQAKDSNVQKSSPRPLIKTGAKQSPSATQSKQREKAFQNMKQSGSVEDVARWIAQGE